jgi:hypothetical protein
MEGATGESRRTESKSSGEGVAGKGERERSDQEMMYAWSIKVNLARNPTEKIHDEESCPPEVYIG